MAGAAWGTPTGAAVGALAAVLMNYLSHMPARDPREVGQ